MVMPKEKAGIEIDGGIYFQAGFFLDVPCIVKKCFHYVTVRT